MNIAEKIKALRNIITIILAAAGIATMLFYTTCETTCSYLQGDIFGIDLMYIGIGYMIVIIILAAFRQMAYVRALLAAGIGVEVYLIAFQFKDDVFCPYCLAFASTVIIAFILNYERPSIPENSMWKRLIYGLGEADLPVAGKMKVPLLLFVLLGYIFIILTFSGSATPAYGTERTLVPSYGYGKYELIVFTDYFCPPCQLLESEIDPALTEFLSGGGVKVTFVDLPVHKETPLYVRYFLYAARVGTSYESALHVRRVLFSLAKKRSALTEEELKVALNLHGVTFTPYDLKPVYPALKKIISTYNIKSTPTCVIKYSNDDTRKYTGTFEIRNGLEMLRATLAINKR
ncbi:MAG TPA: thioredoxin domain-containing protein [Syntrophales bacterium]|nr:thioredoxin domain-containing protein [Syntrophales bacterium]